MVETGGGEVRVVIDEGCPSETHVLIVVQEVGSGQTRPLGSYSVAELKQLTMEYTSRQQSRRQVSQATIYIAANVTRGKPHSTLHVNLLLGDGSVHPPAVSSLSPQTPISPSNWGTVLNTGATLITPLVADTDYIVGVVSVSEGTTEPAVFATSRDFSECFSLPLSNHDVHCDCIVIQRLLAMRLQMTRSSLWWSWQQSQALPWFSWSLCSVLA